MTTAAIAFEDEVPMSNQSVEPAHGWQPKPPKSFDYAGLPPTVGTKLKATATRVRERHRRQAASIIETGRDLLAAKEVLPHGSFGPWLAVEFGWDERTARNYMAVATEFGAKAEIVSDLPMTALYALAAPSVPVDARDAVLARLQVGEKIAPLEVRHIIYGARDAQKEASRLAKLTPDAKKKAAAAQKAHKARMERSNREWQERQEREEALEEQAAEKAADIIHQALGDNTGELEGLLTSNRVGMHTLCRKLRTRMNSPKPVGALLRPTDESLKLKTG